MMNEMSVIKRDFGMAKSRSVRRFTRLLSLDALHEANVRANPLPYLERASERIFQLEKALFEAAEAANEASEPTPAATAPAPKMTQLETTEVETIQVDKAEYQRLLRCRAIVERGLANLATQQDIVAGASD
jgi:hypothetical protein